MKKNLIYIIPAVIAIAILLLFFTGNNSNNKKADQRVTLKRQDKIPYGTYIAYHSLKDLFPRASVFTDRNQPGYWDTLSINKQNQALIVITGQFNADETEMNRLLSFVEKGNTVFISARTLSWKAAEMLQCQVNTSAIPGLEDVIPGDSLHLFLNDPPYEKQKGYFYSGKILDAGFLQIDKDITSILGEDEKGRENFIHLRAGNGSLFLHLAPLAFTNHFLLYRDNFEYYERALSVIPVDVETIVWDEYYLNKKFLEKQSDKTNWFTVLSRYPALKAALLTALLSLLVYVLLEMRRKQRFIPFYAKPKNESLDFVKTIGRLYFDKGDNANLARKMSAYFLEHVRNTYQLPTNILDDQFIRNLQAKSGAGEQQVTDLVSFISYIEQTESIPDKKLAEFHRQLEAFYKLTR